MDVLTLLAVLNLVALVILIALIATRRRRHARAADVALQVDDRLLAFQKAIQEAVHGARQDVQSSTQTMQQSALAVQQALTGLGKTVAGLAAEQQDAKRLAEDLKVVLSAPKLRGNYGEAVLEEMLERVLPAGTWRRQVTIDGRESVDAAIEFKGTLYPIDAKFPRDDYERYLEAPDDEAKRRAWRAFEAAIRHQVDGIARKYVRPEKGTAAFALMFIPSEAVYYETIAHQNGLGEPNAILEYAHARNVIPVSPGTFYAFLQVILTAVRNVDLLTNAKRLQAGLKEVQYSFGKFYERYADMGAHLHRAAEEYRKGNDHVVRFKDRVDRVLGLGFESESEPPVVAMAGRR
jgi:DNA recombination protein RmuC